MNIIITCEHASNKIPEEYNNLGLTKDQLKEHIAYDEGSLNAAQKIARELKAPLFYGKFSRLLIDLNRSINNEDSVIERSHGVIIPGNQNLSIKEREKRISKFYDPYRESIYQCVSQLESPVLHISVHSFSEGLCHTRKRIDLGILHAKNEKLAVALKSLMPERNVFINEPYNGGNDGISKDLENLFAISSITLEFNTNKRGMGLLSSVCKALKELE